MITVGQRLKCSCHGKERFIVKNHPRLGLLCKEGAEAQNETVKAPPDYKKICWDWFSKYIRLGYADDQGLEQCFTCPKIQHWSKMDLGHGITRQHAPTFLDKRNNHPQCATCNWTEEGRKDRYKENMDKKYGAGTWDKLEILSKTTLHRTQFEWQKLGQYFKQEFEKLKLQNKS